MRIHLAASTAVLLLLAACSGESTWQAPEPGPRDEAVAAVLPQGAFTVAGELRMGGRSITTIDGYVDFGSTPDGTDCVADYTLTDVDTSADRGPREVTAVRGVHTPGGPTWYRDMSDPAAPGEWRDISDPLAGGVPLLFAPALIASDFNPGVVAGAGTGNLCSIPVIPRFMSLDAERLVFDQERTAAAVTAGRARWSEMFVDAAGVTGSARDEAIEELLELATVDVSWLTENVYLTIVKGADGVVELLQYKDGEPEPVLRLTFTPTDAREVEQVSAKTFFEKVAEEAQQSGGSSWDAAKELYGL